MVTIDIRHDGLGRFARVSAPSKALAERRAALLTKRWNDIFERRAAALRRPGVAAAEILNELKALERTEEAEHAAAALTGILIEAVRSPPLPDWTPLYETTPFAEPEPAEPAPPPEEPEPQSDAFAPVPVTFAMLFKPRTLFGRRKEAAERYKQAHDGWDYVRRWHLSEHEKALTLFRAAHAAWQERRDAFLDLQRRAHARLDAMRISYRRRETEGVIGHCDLTLLSLDRPQGFPCHWTMVFTEGALHIDYDLPALGSVPAVKAVKYAGGRFKTIVHSEAERERLYGEAVFQTSLAVLHVLFNADTSNAIKSITFNGWVNDLDATGMRPVRVCILSLPADRDPFTAIDLQSVDPKACFRALNGTTNPWLAALAARQVTGG